MSLVILKIGGSVCTNKNEKTLKANSRRIKNIAREIRKALKKNKFELIIVHGGGSFGHNLVEKYKLKNGIRNEKQYIQATLVHESMRKLNEIILQELLKEKIKVLPFEALSLVKQENKKIKSFYIENIKTALKKGFVPVIFGDIVLDTRLKVSVVSGDALIAFLAKKLKAKKVLFGTNVDGIFDNKNNVIKEINRKNFSKALKSIKTVKNDVTGGMKGKLIEIVKNLKESKVLIFNMIKKKNTFDVLNGKNIGTKIKFR